MVEQRHSRHGDRVWYQADDGSVRTLRRDWTSLATPGPFVVIAAGRAQFRFDDLVGLLTLLDDLRQPDGDPEDPPWCVKRISSIA